MLLDPLKSDPSAESLSLIAWACAGLLGVALVAAVAWAICMFRPTPRSRNADRSRDPQRGADGAARP